MMPVSVVQGDGPIILGQPHGGTFVPPEVRQSLNDNGKLLADTDWHIGQLYDALLPRATVVSANFHRYVIDANRDPEGGSLYPGQNTTGLCPLTDFDGRAIYREGYGPNVVQALKDWHQPYHAALTNEIARVKVKLGTVIVFDCHSIRSKIPFLFEGTLPDLNIGTDNGKTCDRIFEKITFEIAGASFRSVLNGRFRGGWTTRHYGQPHNNVHTIQMETAQSAYLKNECAPWNFDAAKAAQLRACLKLMLASLEEMVLHV